MAGGHPPVALTPSFDAQGRLLPREQMSEPIHLSPELGDLRIIEANGEDLAYLYTPVADDEEAPAAA